MPLLCMAFSVPDYASCKAGRMPFMINNGHKLNDDRNRQEKKVSVKAKRKVLKKVH